MMRVAGALLLFLGVGWQGLAQNSTPVPVEANCVLRITNLQSGSTTPVDNTQTGCTEWTFTYNNSGFSALSIVVQTAPQTSLGVPGSWSTFTAATGSNPSTATTQASATFSGYFPYVRVTLSSSTGTGRIDGAVKGFLRAASSGGGSGSVTGGACSAGQYTVSIDTSGVPTCAQVNYSQLTGTVPNAPTATALAANPTDCAAGTFATTIAASGNLTCVAQEIYQGADTGGDDTYVLAPPNFPTAYSTGLMVFLLPSTGNTGAAALDCGPGSKAIKLADGTADPTTGDIQPLGGVWLRYDSTANAAAGAWILRLP